MSLKKWILVIGVAGFLGLGQNAAFADHNHGQGDNDREHGHGHAYGHEKHDRNHDEHGNRGHYRDHDRELQYVRESGERLSFQNAGGGNLYGSKGNQGSEPRMSIDELFAGGHVADSGRLP